MHVPDHKSKYNHPLKKLMLRETQGISHVSSLLKRVQILLLSPNCKTASVKYNLRDILYLHYSQLGHVG
jgi:hypothetical protein